MFECDRSGSEYDELDKDEVEFSCAAKKQHAKADADKSRAAKGGGGVETPPSVRKGKDNKGEGGKSGPKRPQG